MMDHVFLPQGTPRLVSLKSATLTSYFAFGMQQIYQHINLLREEWLHLALSAALAGVVLPYDQFGLNLDDSGKKKDADIERKNFQKAGEALCNLGNNLIIDNYSMKRSNRNPTDKPKELDPIDPKWVEVHCNISKYCLQIT